MLATIKELQAKIHEELLGGLINLDSLTVTKKCNNCDGRGTVYINWANRSYSHNGYNYNSADGHLNCKECNGAGIVNYKIQTKEQ